MANSLTRKVYCADSLKWLPGRKFKAIVTSLPDMNELQLPVKDYVLWLSEAALTLSNAIDDMGCIIFYQTNRKIEGRILDKEFLISSVFFQNGYEKVFQKIILRKKPEVTDLYRPSFSKMFCFSRRLTSGIGGPDVIYTGKMITPNAMGLNACLMAVNFIKKKVDTDVIVDPFCGSGAVLAVANENGFHAVGVDIDKRMVSIARKLKTSIMEVSI